MPPDLLSIVNNERLPPELDAADAEDGHESAEEDEAGNGEHGHLDGAQAAAPLLPPHHNLPHAHVLEALQGQLAAQLLAAHHAVALEAVEPHLGHEAGCAHAAGGNLKIICVCTMSSLPGDCCSIQQHETKCRSNLLIFVTSNVWK